MRLYFILIILLIIAIPNWMTAQTRTVTFLVTVEDDDKTYNDSNTKIYFHPRAINEWDVYDATKLTPLANFYVSFGFLGMRADELRNKAQDSRPLFLAERIEIDIRLLLMQIEGQVSIGISDFTNIPDDWEFYIVDTEIDSTVNIREEQYIFDQTLGDSFFYQTDDRFKVIVDPQSAYNKSPTISGSGWKMMGWPVTGQQISDLAAFGPIQGISELPDEEGSPNIFTNYDGEDWIIPDQDWILEPGNGFIWYNFSNTNISPVYDQHEIHYEEISIPLHDVEDGWNLIANPWFYPIDFNDLEISGGTLDSDVALWWDSQAGEGLGSYINSNTTNGIIPPMTGFFVKNSTASEITFPVTAQRIEETLELLSIEHSNHVQFKVSAYRNNELVHYNKALVLKSEGGVTELPVSFDDSGIASGFKLTGSDQKFVQISDSEFKDNSTVFICIESESHLDHADIYVSSSQTQLKWKINNQWEDVGSVNRIELNGGSKCIPLGKSQMVTSEESNQIPETIQITSYPNPFNPIATIAFSLPTPENITLEIFDIHGRLLETLAEGRFAAGQHSFQWDGKNYGSGMYLYRLRLDHVQITDKMILIK